VFERQSEPPFAPPKPLLLDHLIDCVENHKRPIAVIDDARRSLAAALAAYESAKKKSEV